MKGSSSEVNEHWAFTVSPDLSLKLMLITKVYESEISDPTFWLTPTFVKFHCSDRPQIWARISDLLFYYVLIKFLRLESPENSPV